MLRFRIVNMAAAGGLGTALLIVCSSGSVAQTVTASVTAEYTNQATLTLRIARTTPLSVVLREFCLQTHSECDVQAVPQTLLVPVVTISGTWNQALEKLLEGAGLNYVITPASATMKGRLVVKENRAPPFAGNQIPARIPDSPTLAAQPSLPSHQAEPSSNKAAEEGFVQGYPDANARADGARPISEGSSPSLPSPDGRTASPANSSPIPIAPLPDAKGKPIQIDSQAFFPLPDSHGRPIPVTPSSQHVQNSPLPPPPSPKP